jgi:ribosomal-protein-alanine N-acetyltransferase
VTILRAGPAHPVVLGAIHAAAFPAAEAWSVTMFAAQLGLPGVFALLDEAGGMILVRVAADESEILTLAVAPQARRRGLGRALVQAALDAATQAGAATMFLEVSDRNEAALTLYEAAGFRATGRRRRYYVDGTDAVTMAATLPSSRAGIVLPSSSIPP